MEYFWKLVKRYDKIVGTLYFSTVLPFDQMVQRGMEVVSQK